VAYRCSSASASRPNGPTVITVTVIQTAEYPLPGIGIAASAPTPMAASVARQSLYQPSHGRAPAALPRLGSCRLANRRACRCGHW
jgi:hypothetical protein